MGIVATSGEPAGVSRPAAGDQGPPVPPNHRGGVPAGVHQAGGPAGSQRGGAGENSKVILHISLFWKVPCVRDSSFLLLSLAPPPPRARFFSFFSHSGNREDAKRSSRKQVSKSYMKGRERARVGAQWLTSLRRGTHLEFFRLCRYTVLLPGLYLIKILNISNSVW